MPTIIIMLTIIITITITTNKNTHLTLPSKSIVNISQQAQS
jgi:hypothetical protein